VYDGLSRLVSTTRQYYEDYKYDGYPVTHDLGGLLASESRTYDGASRQLTQQTIITENALKTRVNTSKYDDDGRMIYQKTVKNGNLEFGMLYQDSDFANALLIGASPLMGVMKTVDHFMILTRYRLDSSSATMTRAYYVVTH